MKWSEKNEPVDIDFDRIVHMTDKAILFKIEDDDVWLPKSVIADVEDLEDHDMGEPGHFSVPRWVAVERGWE
jgi:hypothetical protein